MRLLLLALALLAAPAAAQDDPLAATARSYVDGESVQRKLDRMLSPEVMSRNLVTQLADTLSEEDAERVTQVVGEELAAIRARVEEAMFTAVTEVYTLEELEALASFHDTPEGASVLIKTEAFQNAFYANVIPKLLAAQSRAVDRIQSSDR